MLSTTSRLLTYSLAVLYAVLGAILFFASGQLATEFAWKVTPFMTMTIGAWCLGNAWAAWQVARRGQWERVYTGLLYLWIFGALQTYVLIDFRQNLLLAHPLAWLYLATIAVSDIAAVLGVAEWFRLRPAASSAGGVSGFLHGLVVVFVVAVGFLGIYGLSAPMGARATHADIFPEVMSLFTLRSFGAFYLALALSVIPLISERAMSTLIFHSLAAYGLLVTITVAALVYIRLFDFAAKPFQAAYIGAYLVVGIVIGVLLAMYRTALD